MVNFRIFETDFLVACTRLYKSLCRSVGRSVCLSVGLSVYRSVCLSVGLSHFTFGPQIRESKEEEEAERQWKPMGEG